MPEKVEVSTIEGTARFTKEVTAAETPKEVKNSNENFKTDVIKRVQKSVIDKGEVTDKDTKHVSNEAEADKTKKMDLIEGDVKKVEAELKPDQIEAKTSKEESKKIEEAKEAIKKWMTSASMQCWRIKQNEVISTSEAENETDCKTSKKEFIEKITKATENSNQDKVTSEADSKPTEKQIMDNQTTENLGKVDIKVDADLDEAKNKEIEAKTINAIDKVKEETMETNEAKEKDLATKRKADETEPIHVSAEKVAKISGENVDETAKEKKVQT